MLGFRCDDGNLKLRACIEQIKRHEDFVIAEQVFVVDFTEVIEVPKDVPLIDPQAKRVKQIIKNILVVEPQLALECHRDDLHVDELVRRRIDFIDSFVKFDELRLWDQLPDAGFFQADVALAEMEAKLLLEGFFSIAAIKDYDPFHLLLGPVRELVAALDELKNGTRLELIQLELQHHSHPAEVLLLDVDMHRHRLGHALEAKVPIVISSRFHLEPLRVVISGLHLQEPDLEAGALFLDNAPSSAKLDAG